MVCDKRSRTDYELKKTFNEKAEGKLPWWKSNTSTPTILHKTKVSPTLIIFYFPEHRKKCKK